MDKKRSVADGFGRNVTGMFGGRSEADEIEQLGNAIERGENLFMDEDGVITTGGRGTLNTPNQTMVKNDPFAGSTPSESEELEQLGRAMESGEDLQMDEFGILTSVTGNPGSLGQGNMTRVSNDPFAARPQIPSNPDQWYNKNPALFRAEVSYMFARHPKAVYGFFKSTGNMYWIVTLKITQHATKPWTFLLQYDKNHPNNKDYGGSIKVQLLKSPSLEEVRARARACGRPGVPHLVKDRRVDGEEYTYLCTRRSEDVADGRESATSAVQVAAWAADWAGHFEVGLRNKEVWNQWVDDDHFRHLKI